MGRRSRPRRRRAMLASPRLAAAKPAGDGADANAYEPASDAAIFGPRRRGGGRRSCGCRDTGGGRRRAAGVAWSRLLARGHQPRRDHALLRRLLPRALQLLSAGSAGLRAPCPLGGALRMLALRILVLLTGAF